MMKFTFRRKVGYDPIPLQPDTLLPHLRQAADLVGARFSEECVRTSLAVFDEELRNCFVMLRTVSKPGGGLNFRFIYFGDKDLIATAQAGGLIPKEDSPMISLLRKTISKFPGSMQHGIDFDTDRGLGKIWVYTGGPVFVQRLLELPAIPDTMRKYAPFFARHGLQHIVFVASDFQDRTMNIYPFWEPECRTKSWLRRIMDDAGEKSISDDLIDDILKCLTPSAALGFTFRWDRVELCRWAVYEAAFPTHRVASREATDAKLGRSVLDLIPSRLHPFCGQAPTLNLDPHFSLAWSFGPLGHYIKMERTYAQSLSYYIAAV